MNTTYTEEEFKFLAGAMEVLAVAVLHNGQLMEETFEKAEQWSNEVLNAAVSLFEILPDELVKKLLKGPQIEAKRKEFQLADEQEKKASEEASVRAEEASDRHGPASDW